MMGLDIGKRPEPHYRQLNDDSVTITRLPLTAGIAWESESPSNLRRYLGLLLKAEIHEQQDTQVRI